MPLLPGPGPSATARGGSAPGWFGMPRPSGYGGDRQGEPFFRRHFWPPSLWGGLAVALVVAVLVGFFGAWIYTSSEQGRIEAADAQAGVPAATLPLAPAESEATTTTLGELSADALTKKVAPSIWTVSTLDDAGRPSEGSAFVTGSSRGQTFLLTSLAVVRAATRLPGPGITARNGGNQVDATLWTWHEERDLALLAIPRVVPSLVWAESLVGGGTGQKVYGSFGPTGNVVAGVVSSASPAAIGHNVFTDAPRRGGALLTTRGEVIGMLSADYDPTRTATDQTFFAVPIEAACERVLMCGTTPTTVRRPAGPGPGTTTTTTSP